MAYEWSYNGITSSNKVSMSHDDMAYSNLLKEHFPDYVNNLQLHDSVGRVLKLDKNGNGTFKNYVKEFTLQLLTTHKLKVLIYLNIHILYVIIKPVQSKILTGKLITNL